MFDAVNELNAHGHVVLDQIVAADVMDSVAIELEDTLSETPHSSNRTRRIHSSAVLQSKAVQALFRHELVMAINDQILGPNCVKYQISSIQGIAVDQGAAHQALHRDDDIFRLPHPHLTFELNVMWAVTDFTKENGATRLINGSHTWPTGRSPENDPIWAATMKKGSALLWLGSTWLPPHQVRQLDESLQRLLGYELKGTSTLGWVNGMDPRTYLELE